MIEGEIKKPLQGFTGTLF